MKRYKINVGNKKKICNTCENLQNPKNKTKRYVKLN